LLAGDAETGVCIMQMEAGLDTGPVLLRGAFAIEATDTTATLHDRLAGLGARLVVDALGKLPLPPEPQPTEGVTYAHKIEKAEALIDWSKSAAELDRHIRAFNPFPGAQAVFGGQTVKVWKASPVDRQGESGTVLAVDRSGVVIACGDGALAVTELQKAGASVCRYSSFWPDIRCRSAIASIDPPDQAAPRLRGGGKSRSTGGSVPTTARLGFSPVFW
jgi:methionyl-tRNA formyltransferase